MMACSLDASEHMAHAKLAMLARVQLCCAAVPAQQIAARKRCSHRTAVLRLMLMGRVWLPPGLCILRISLQTSRSTECQRSEHLSTQTVADSGIGAPGQDLHEASSGSLKPPGCPAIAPGAG